MFCARMNDGSRDSRKTLPSTKNIASDDHVHRPGERAGHLPHLGVDEQERHEQQQQRERPDDQVEERRELRPRAPARPAEQRHDAVARQRPHGAQDDGALEHGLHDVAPLAERRPRARPGTTTSRASSTGPIVSGRCSGGRPRITLAPTHVSTRTATTNAAASTLREPRPLGEVEGVEPEQQVGDDEQRIARPQISQPSAGARRSAARRGRRTTARSGQLARSTGPPAGDGVQSATAGRT